MKTPLPIAIPFALVLAAAGPSAPAQGMPGKMDTGRMSGPGYEVTPELQRYRQMAGLMRDMSQLMAAMKQRLAKGEMSLEAQRRMQQQLAEMSDMMWRMAGLADRPTMNDPEIRKQTEEMRKQMDSMMRAGSAP